MLNTGDTNLSPLLSYTYLAYSLYASEKAAAVRPIQKGHAMLVLSHGENESTMTPYIHVMHQSSVSPLSRGPFSLGDNIHDTLHSIVAFLLMSKSGCAMDVSDTCYAMKKWNPNRKSGPSVLND